MRKIILYVATSMDGYIAREDGSVDWLDKFPIEENQEDYGYTKFYDSIDTTLMGNTTYKQIVAFEQEFPYSDKQNFVFSNEKNSENKDPNVEYADVSLVDFIRDIKSKDGQNIWLVGGSRLNSEMLVNNLIDEIIITKLPLTLGKGISLFDASVKDTLFSVSNVKSYQNGVLQIHYQKK